MKKSPCYGPVLLQLIPLGGAFPCAPPESELSRLGIRRATEGMAEIYLLSSSASSSDVCGIADIATATLWDVPSGNM